MPKVEPIPESHSYTYDISVDRHDQPDYCDTLSFTIRFHTNKPTTVEYLRNRYLAPTLDALSEKARSYDGGKPSASLLSWTNFIHSAADIQHVIYQNQNWIDLIIRPPIVVDFYLRVPDFKIARKFCPACGSLLPRTVTFCTACGHLIGSTHSAPDEPSIYV